MKLNGINFRKLPASLRRGRISLRAYLAFSYAIFVLFGLAGTGLYWLRQQEISAEQALLLQLHERARILSTLGIQESQSPNSFQLPSTIIAFNSNLRVVFISPELKVTRISDLDLEENERANAIEFSREALQGHSVSQEIYYDTGETLYAASPVYGENQKIVGVVCLLLPLDDFQATMNTLRNQLFLGAALLAGLSMLLAFGLVSLFIDPIEKAKGMAARVAGGDYSVRLPSTPFSELAELSDHLNQMAAELEQQSKERVQVLSNVTHELARPLGGLRLGIDSLLDGGLTDPAFAEDLLSEIGRTLRRIEALIEDLALAARPSQAPLKLSLKPVEVGELMLSVCNRINPIAEARGITLKLEVHGEPSPVLAEEVRLYQIMGNLADNAVKFTPTGGEIILSAEENSEGVELSVLDSGPGIPQEEMPHVFDMFYQGKMNGPVRTGMGLGLPIVRRLVEAHGARLVLENMPWGGLMARVIFPKHLTHI